jgi:cytidylate kinase
MRGEDVGYEEVLEDLQKRDALDMGREVDPLHITEGRGCWIRRG